MNKLLYQAHQEKIKPEFVTGLVSASTGSNQFNDGGLVEPLSERELEVLRLIALGGSTRVIASRLQRSVKTISTHRQNLMRKLGIHNIAGLTRHAIRLGLVTADEPSIGGTQRSGSRPADADHRLRVLESRRTASGRRLEG